MNFYIIDLLCYCWINHFTWCRSIICCMHNVSSSHNVRNNWLKSNVEILQFKDLNGSQGTSNTRLSTQNGAIQILSINGEDQEYLGGQGGKRAGDMLWEGGWRLLAAPGLDLISSAWTCCCFPFCSLDLYQGGHQETYGDLRQHISPFISQSSWLPPGPLDAAFPLLGHLVHPQCWGIGLESYLLQSFSGNRKRIEGLE